MASYDTNIASTTLDKLYRPDGKYTPAQVNAIRQRAYEIGNYYTTFSGDLSGNNHGKAGGWIPPAANEMAITNQLNAQRPDLFNNKNINKGGIGDIIGKGVEYGTEGLVAGGIAAGTAGAFGVGPLAGGGSTALGTGAAANTGAYADMAAQAAGGIMPGADAAAAGATGGIAGTAGTTAATAAPAAATTGAGSVPGWGSTIQGVGQIAGGLAASGILGDHGASAANDAARNAAQTSADASKQQAAIAQDQWDNYKKTFQPLEQDLAAKAKTYGTPAEQEAAAGRANADVTASFDQQRKAQELGLAGSRKLNPNDPAYAATIASTNLSQAATSAGAQTQARIQARDQGFAKELDAIGIGKGIPASSANTLGNVAATTGIRGSPAFNQAQTLNNQQAQGVYGLTNLAQKGFNTWSGGNSGSNVSAPSGWTPEQTAAYDGSGVTGDSTMYLRKGGIVRGRGTETSDSNPAMLSKHEAVLNAGAVRIIGHKAIKRLNDMGMQARGGIHKRHPVSLPAKLMALHGARA